MMAEEMAPTSVTVDRFWTAGHDDADSTKTTYWTVFLGLKHAEAAFEFSDKCTHPSKCFPADWLN